MSEQPTRGQLSFLDKVFPALILLCMAAGLALGKVAPGVGHGLEPLVPLGLFPMIYPTVTNRFVRCGVQHWNGSQRFSPLL